MQVANGSYSDTQIAADSTKTSLNHVVFRPVAGATVNITASTFTVNASHVEVQGFRFANEWWVGPSTTDVTFRNTHASSFYIASEGSQYPSDISVIGGDVGPAVDTWSTIGSNGLNATSGPKNVLIDGVRFHDYTVSAGSGSHTECLQVWGADGLTIRNSRFTNCYYFDILFNHIQGGNTPTPTNILVENNFFECCGAPNQYSVRLSDSWGGVWNNVTIRNNSSNSPMSIGTGTTYTNVKVTANIMPKVDGTPAGVAFDYNVWYQGTKIGTHDQSPHPDSKTPQTPTST